MELTYEEKIKELNYLKRYLQRCKQILISKRIGQGEYISNSFIIKLTSMIVTSIELIEVYKECEINELDSVMDMLSDINPEFYNSANKLYEINLLNDNKKSPIQGLNRHSSNNNGGIKLKSKMLTQRLESLLIPESEQDQYFGNNKKPL